MKSTSSPITANLSTKKDMPAIRIINPLLDISFEVLALCSCMSCASASAMKNANAIDAKKVDMFSIFIA